MKAKEGRFQVLFLCTGNSARSIMAEYFLNRAAPDKFEAYSAGASPRGEVHPFTLRILREDNSIDATAAESKSWDVFKGKEFDFVITVCDHAKETCPVWPGQPIVAHWGSQDPLGAEDEGEEAMYRLFKKVAVEIRRRVELFSCLPFHKLDRFRLQHLTKQIGTQDAEAVPGEAEEAASESKEA